MTWLPSFRAVRPPSTPRVLAKGRSPVRDSNALLLRISANERESNPPARQNQRWDNTMTNWLNQSAVKTFWLIMGGYALIRMMERER